MLRVRAYLLVPYFGVDVGWWFKHGEVYLLVFGMTSFFFARCSYWRMDFVGLFKVSASSVLSRLCDVSDYVYSNHHFFRCMNGRRTSMGL